MAYRKRAVVLTGKKQSMFGVISGTGEVAEESRCCIISPSPVASSLRFDLRGEVTGGEGGAELWWCLFSSLVMHSPLSIELLTSHNDALSSFFRRIDIGNLSPY